MKVKTERIICSGYLNRVSFCQACFNCNEVWSESERLGQVQIYPALRDLAIIVSMKSKDALKDLFSLYQLIVKKGTRSFSSVWKKKRWRKNYWSISIPSWSTSRFTSCTNWNLNLFDVSDCLSVLHTLRNKSNFEEMKIL